MSHVLTTWKNIQSSARVAFRPAQNRGYDRGRFHRRFFFQSPFPQMQRTIGRIKFPSSGHPSPGHIKIRQIVDLVTGTRIPPNMLPAVDIQTDQITVSTRCSKSRTLCSILPSSNRSFGSRGRAVIFYLISKFQPKSNRGEKRRRWPPEFTPSMLNTPRRRRASCETGTGRGTASVNVKGNAGFTCILLLSSTTPRLNPVRPYLLRLLPILHLIYGRTTVSFVQQFQDLAVPPVRLSSIPSSNILARP